MSESVAATDDGVVRPSDKPLLEVRELKKHYPITSGVFRRQTGSVKAVDGVSFDVNAGETFAIVGESGCGKTTLGRTVASLVKPTGGEVVFDGRVISGLGDKELKSVRRDIQVVYQDPTSSLNPRKRIKSIIAEPLIVHDIGTKAERRQRVEELLQQVDLPVDFQYRYPGALSGGQKQRVAIARALALNPRLLVLDEPTSALDVSVQAKVISLLNDLQAEYDLAYVIITHDLSLVKNIADRIGVMYLGKFMELTTSDALFDEPKNPYTEQLLSAIPIVEDAELAYIPERIELKGETPDPANPPSGCSFHPRCHKVFDECHQIEPALYEVDGDHHVRCLLFRDEESQG